MAISLLLVWVVSTAAAQPINVMTYNIRYDNPKDGVNEWNKRKAKVFQLLKKYDPDILGVQEALNNQMNDVVGNLKEYKFVGVGRDDGKEKGEFSAILYKKERFEVIEQNTFWLSETPEVPGSKSWDAAITRVATWAKFRDKQTNREFLVINTHFDHIGKEARKKSAALLKTKATELKNGLPMIITGDFNFTRDDDPYDIMMDTSGVIIYDSAPRNSAGTACGFELNSLRCNAIDYIFYTPEWIIQAYSVISDNDGKYFPSDHLPVMAKVTTN